MTPKEKAEELFNKYYEIMISANNILNISRAKEYALMAVDFTLEFNDFHIEYLYEVKEEIEKL
jgi:hypothetical protein